MGHLGPEPDALGRVAGRRLQLEPVTAANAANLEELDRVRETSSMLGGPFARVPGRRSFGPDMLVREKPGGQVVGVLENGEMIGYPGVAVVIIFVDRKRARVGTALEAYALFLGQVFRHGARRVHLEVFDFNSGIRTLLEKMGQSPSARLREHAYVAGGFHDLLVYSFDEPAWRRQAESVARHLPWLSD